MFFGKDLSETQETLKSFLRQFYVAILLYRILLILRRLLISLFYFPSPKSPFLVFWQMWTMTHWWHGYDRWPQIYFLAEEHKQFDQSQKRESATYTTLITKKICSFVLLYNSPKRRSCWTRFSISLRAFTYPLPSVRSWNKFRMTLGGSCYFYSHFGRPNSILMSNSITLCQIFSLPPTHLT